MEYHKLVRDKIPELMAAQGKNPQTCVLEGAAWQAALEKKLDEEVAEFHADKNLEELADILEVLLSLTETLGHTSEELEQVRREKQIKRGGFRKGIFLISDRRE